MTTLMLAAETSLSGFARRVQAVTAELVRRHRVRATARALRGLSDAALKDIGLHRSEAASVAAGDADRRRT